MKYSVEICLRELLFVQECVIIPGFGGFLTKYKSADIDYLNYSITPPTKSISFNRQLRNDDGLLVNTFSMLNGISFSEANIFVRKWITQFEANLKAHNSFELAQIGTFEWDASGSTISFTPDLTENYLIESYGFPVIIAKPIFRNAPLTETVIPVKQEAVIVETVQEPVLAEPFLKTTTDVPIIVEPVNARNVVLLCIGIFSIAMMTLPLFGVRSDKMNLNEGNVLSVFTSVFPSKSVEVAPLILDNIATPELSVINEVKIVAPVFVAQEAVIEEVAKPIEKINDQPAALEVKETLAPLATSSSSKYVVIMGAFKDKKNADMFSAKISAESNGLTAVVIAKGAVSYVAIPAGETPQTAAEKLKLAKSVNPDCWIKKM